MWFCAAEVHLTFQNYLLSWPSSLKSEIVYMLMPIPTCSLKKFIVQRYLCIFFPIFLNKLFTKIFLLLFFVVSEIENARQTLCHCDYSISLSLAQHACQTVWLWQVNLSNTTLLPTLCNLCLTTIDSVHYACAKKGFANCFVPLMNSC